MQTEVTVLHKAVAAIPDDVCAKELVIRIVEAAIIERTARSTIPDPNFRTHCIDARKSAAVEESHVQRAVGMASRIVTGKEAAARWSVHAHLVTQKHEHGVLAAPKRQSNMHVMSLTCRRLATVRVTNQAFRFRSIRCYGILPELTSIQHSQRCSTATTADLAISFSRKDSERYSRCFRASARSSEEAASLPQLSRMIQCSSKSRGSSRIPSRVVRE